MVPARVAREDPHPLDHRGDRVRIGVEVDHHHPAPAHAAAQAPRSPQGRRAPYSRHSAASRLTGPPMNIVLGLVAAWPTAANTLYTAVSLGRFSTTPSVPPSLCSTTVDDAAPKRRLQQIGVGEQQRPSAHPVGRGSDEMPPVSSECATSPSWHRGNGSSWRTSAARRDICTVSRVADLQYSSTRM